MKMQKTLNGQRPTIKVDQLSEIAEDVSRNLLFLRTRRFDLVLDQGEGSYVWDVERANAISILAGGIAVCALGPRATRKSRRR